jgi:hypothetical protein
MQKTRRKTVEMHEKHQITHKQSKQNFFFDCLCVIWRFLSKSIVFLKVFGIFVSRKAILPES